MPERLAIVGTGIAGLGCAHFLHPHFDLTLFEAGSYIGGHTNTIETESRIGTISFDTGFMVFNRVTYPRLCRLFDELQVPTQPTSMSFSVQHLEAHLEFNGSSINHLFAQRRNLLRPRFWRLLRQINRFNQEAVTALDDPKWSSVSLRNYINQRIYGDDFWNLYLVPMSSAVWSTPPDRMSDFPAVTLLRFFHNHGFLGLNTQHPWWTIRGGAREYVRRLIPPFANRVRLKTPVQSVRRLPQTNSTSSSGIEVQLANGSVEQFDRVILACHADQSLRILKDANALEREILGAFHYQPNLATVHTDESLMPRNRLAWAAWNYRIDSKSTHSPDPQTIYWMNQLQGLSGAENFFVSINGAHHIRPDRIVRQIPYEHPLFSLEALRAQYQLPRLNSQTSKTCFCGSYFRYGFHEDAFSSAVDLASTLLNRAVWPDTPAAASHAIL